MGEGQNNSCPGAVQQILEVWAEGLPEMYCITTALIVTVLVATFLSSYLERVCLMLKLREGQEFSPHLGFDLCLKKES